MAGPQIVTTPTDSAWQADAACAGHPEPDLFHPVPGGMTRDKAQAIRDAKDVCGGCPVRAQCLRDALTNGFEGIWGGTTDQERAAIGVAKKHPTRPNAPTWSERCGSYSGVSRHRKLLEQFCPDCRVARNEYEGGRKKRQRAARRLGEAS